MNKILSVILLSFLFSGITRAQNNTIYVYGPGGPYPPINEAAERFSHQHGIKVIVTKGPLKNWQDKAKTNADLFYSGSEDMMSTFMSVFEDEMNTATIYPLYYRGSGLIVRKGNPHNIRKLTDLQKPGLNIMIVKGAGLTGVWEDMLGSLRNMDALRKIRANIKVFADNSGIAEKTWKENPGVDVWISWNIWQKMNAGIADFVSLKTKHTIYRDCGMALSKKGTTNSNARLFYDYLKTSEAAAIFKKWGWK
ncbi:MAG: substrate-binding domain-containing protein [Chitinophagaceae bacterium]|nr:substrate-binding domain-containing protein [Chitinophagaceae bacterium]